MYDWPIIKEIVPVFQAVLEWIYSFIGSYGWSIVILTVLFRGAMLPLDIKSKLSMKKQALLQPKIAKINEKYKNDKEKAAQKTMELYKQEKASPFSGCLPVLLQWPLFIAFFGALQYIASHQIHELYVLIINQGVSAAQSHIEPWLWVHNVWAPDTAMFGPGGFNFMGWNSAIIPPYSAVMAFKDFQGISESQYNAVMGSLIARTSANYNGWFLLPLLAGITSWWQTKITMPATPPAQTANQPKNPFSGKTMQYVFLAMTVVFTASSNSVFALYWITSNLVAIATYKGVDIFWKMREQKRELAEKEKDEGSASQAKLAAPDKAPDAKPAAPAKAKEGLKR